MSIQLPDARSLSDDALQVLRLRALRGVELGYSEVELAELLGLTNETISRWWCAYVDAGIDALPGERTGRPDGSGRALSNEQERTLQQRIADRSPADLGLPHALWTRRAVGDLIRREYDIDLADRTVGNYLRRWGFTPKKPARHAQKQDPDELEHWLLDTYPDIEEQAAKEDAEILWTDEVGVQGDHHPGRGYGPVGERITLEVPATHVRVNMISAISNEGTVRFMTYPGMLNAAVFLLFLERLVAGATRKILLIADNLPAHKTPAVQAWVEAHRDRLEVFYLPPYAPESNPVEYLNNDLKGQVNAAGLAADRPTLQSRVLGFMGKLSRLPGHVIGYFLQPQVHYAAPAELI